MSNLTSVHVCGKHELVHVITCHHLLPTQDRIPNLDQKGKTPWLKSLLFWWPWPSMLNLTYHPFKLESSNLDQMCEIPRLRSLLFWGWLTLSFKVKLILKRSNFLVSPLQEMHNHQGCHEYLNWDVVHRCSEDITQCVRPAVFEGSCSDVVPGCVEEVEDTAQVGLLQCVRQAHVRLAENHPHQLLAILHSDVLMIPCDSFHCEWNIESKWASDPLPHFTQPPRWDQHLWGCFTKVETV